MTVSNNNVTTVVLHNTLLLPIICSYLDKRSIAKLSRCDRKLNSLFVDFFLDRNNSAGVKLNWCQRSTFDGQWHRFTRLVLEDAMPAEFLAFNFKEKCADLTHLSLSPGSEIGPGNDTVAFRAIATLTKLKGLRLFLFQIGPEETRELTALTCLEELQLNYTKCGVGLQVLTTLNKLRVLGLVSNNPTPAIVQSFTALKNLRVLDLSRNAEWMSPEHVQALTQLEELYLSHNTIQSVLELAPLKQLKVLNLAANSVNMASIPALTALSNLQALDLSSNIPVNGSLENLKLLTQLRVLHLNENHINTRQIPHIASLTQLQELSLKQNPDIKLPGYQALTSLQQLRKLNLAGNHQWTRERTVALAKLTNLRDLNMMSCCLELPMVQTIASSLPHLRTLDIRGNWVIKGQFPRIRSILLEAYPLLDIPI